MINKSYGKSLKNENQLPNFKNYCSKSAHCAPALLSAARHGHETSNAARSNRARKLDFTVLLIIGHIRFDFVVVVVVAVVVFVLRVDLCIIAGTNS